MGVGMSYSYDRTGSSIPSYKGKVLAPGSTADTWILEGYKCRVICKGQEGRGWKAKLLGDGDPFLPGETYGRDLEDVISKILHVEYQRVKGIHHRANELEKALDSLGGE